MRHTKSCRVNVSHQWYTIHTYTYVYVYVYVIGLIHRCDTSYSTWIIPSYDSVTHTWFIYTHMTHSHTYEWVLIYEFVKRHARHDYFHALQRTATTLQRTAAYLWNVMFDTIYSTHCNALQLRCNTLQRTATHCNMLCVNRDARHDVFQLWHDSFIRVTWITPPETHCNTLQHCSTLQHMLDMIYSNCDMTHLYVRKYLIHVWHDSFIRVTWLIHMCDMPHSFVWHDVLPTSLWNTLQHAAANCNTMQHTATHCNTLQHTATH